MYPFFFEGHIKCSVWYQSLLKDILVNTSHLIYWLLIHIWKAIMIINPQFWNYERLHNVLLSVFVVWLVQEKTAYKSKSADGRLFFWCSVTENKQSNRSAEFLFQISSISFHHWDLIFLLYFCILTSENESHLYLLAKLFNSACLRETQLKVLAVAK